MYALYTLPLLFLIFHSTCNATEVDNIAQFESENLENWQGKSFQGNTHYQITSLEGKKVLKATAVKTASGIAKERTINLLKTPFINWSWRIEDRLIGLDETKKRGDDYAARLYLVKSGGLFIWNTKALNYVWASNQKKGAHWDNAYAGDNAKMLAIRSAKDPLNEWIFEKRNVFNDMISLFGDQGSQKANEEAYGIIDVVAIMTDTDDSGRTATAYYGDIFFTAQ